MCPTSRCWRRPPEGPIPSTNAGEERLETDTGNPSPSQPVAGGGSVCQLHVLHVLGTGEKFRCCQEVMVWFDGQRMF